ncbi:MULTISPECIES: HAMP domain-containing sensor histidine kinase [unclassified Nocardioides]|uniref:sensor histidine kinase n=1 Tax=unclassified Nocardioides TaxID=2615069 RepID=UPI00114E5640|nr:MULTISPECIES: HAMP domain-containing sensor histidine kinase [unclassified Nocardioides]TQK68552.1 signal transduction histidine kinase [Nocardioides sp. SLBN-35]WGY02152.1 HAMP domain-containing sensor histidine kinase [Nocardioides sp. QY071]
MPSALSGWRHSLRTRITLAVLGAALATLLGVGVVVDHQSAVDARDRLRTQALTELSAGIAVLEVTSTLRYDLSLDPVRLPAPLRTSLPAAGEDRAATYYADGRMWAARRLGPDRVASVALDDGPVRAARSSLRRRMLLAAGAVLPLTALLGLLVGAGLSRRLRRAAAAAEVISHGGTARCTVTGRDEVAALSRAVDDMADALERRFHVEQAFSADVAHELRTPVAGLVSASELLPPGEPTDLLRGLVARLRHLVEDLLEVARLDSGTEEIALSVHHLGALVPGAAVERDAKVLVDPRRVERIVTNLVANAERHGGGVTSLVVDGPRVVVRDGGTGFPADILTAGAIRFRSTGQGTGLGLTIVHGQARTLGATVTMANLPAGGAEVVVSFQEPGPSSGSTGSTVCSG